MPATVLVSGALSTVGCGGLAVIDGENAATGGGSSSTTSVTNTATSSSTGGGGTLRIRLLQALARANCQPVTPPDPLGVTFTLQLENTSSLAAEASMLGGRLEGSQGSTSFQITPMTSGSVGPGNTMDVDFEKVDNSGFGTPGCAWCMSTDARLVLEIEVNSQPQPLDEPINSVSCVF